MTAVLAALAGAAMVGGLTIAVGGLIPAPPRKRRRFWKPKAATTNRARWQVWRWPIALAGGMLAWLLTGWPVAALIVAVTVLGLPVLLSTAAVASAAIDRVEAVEEWTRRLSDILTVGVGLEQAISATVRTSPAPIKPEVETLAARLGARWPAETALRAFADDLDDASADLVVATLLLASRRRGPGLARVLAAVADSVAEEVAVRRRVEAERAKPRTTARAVTLITLAVVGIGALNGTYLRPYGTLLGQLVLASVAAAFVAALLWMRALTLATPQTRILTEAGDPR